MAPNFGLGTRSHQFAMIVEDGEVEQLYIEEGLGVDVSSAETVMALLLKQVSTARHAAVWPTIQHSEPPRAIRSQKR